MPRLRPKPIATGKHPIHYRLALTILAISIGQNSYAISPRQCLQEARTELETAYCEIKQKGGGATLPSFFQFRVNTPATQRLLLQRPAKKFNIALPAPAEPTKQQANKPPAPRITDGKRDQPVATTKSLSSPPKDTRATLAKCSLKQDQILCNTAVYNLVANKILSELSAQALGPSNQLELPERLPGTTHLQYLSSVYPHYVEKMLLIGLGDSTVSFTKFHAMHQQSLTQQQSFSERFKKMYELLKAERKSLAVKRRYRNNFPATIDDCMQLNDTLVACDNVKQNWVYKRASY